MRRHRETYQAALVTGASRGLGRAFVEALPDGTDLVLTARDRNELDAVAAACARPGRRIETIAADLTRASDQQIVIRAAGECDVDLVIANAGAGLFGKFVESDAAAHIAAVRLNIESTLNIAHALLPGMIQQAQATHGRAGMVIVSSSTAFAPVPKLAVYAATKSFLLSWSEALSAEHSDDPVDILAFCPGAVRTDFAQNAGFSGGDIPGAMAPSFAAKAALSALGRKRTLVLDQLGAIPLSAIALGRAAFAEVAGRFLGRVS